MAFNRDLLRGSLDLMVLSDLADCNRYGYQVLTSLRARSGGRVDLKAGTLYPILYKLEEEGAVRSWWDDTSGRDRKWYALTERGRERLRADAKQWLDYSTCVHTMIQAGLTASP